MHSHVLHSCLLLNPRLTRQNDFTQKAVQTWLPLYRVEKFLTNSNYIIRKTGTNYTQCVHRIRLRPIKLTEPPEDIQEIDPAKFEADPSRRTTRNEPELFDEYIPNLLEEEQSTAISKTATVQPSQIRLGVTVPPNGAPATPLAAPVPPIVPVIPPIPVIPPAEIRTPSPMNSPRNSQENSPRASLSDSPEIIATPEEFQYPERLPAAAESEIIRENDEEDTEQQPGPSTRSNQNRVNFAKMRGVRKFESWEPVARYGSRSQTPQLPESPTQPPILTKEQKHQLIAESSRRSRRDQIPTRETKLDQVRSSIERYQRGSTADNIRVTRSQSKSKQTTSNINVIEIGKTRANFFYHRGDILNSRRSFARCISSNMKMSKGLAWQIVNYYTEMLQSQEFAQRPPGSVISFYDTNLN